MSVRLSSCSAGRWQSIGRRLGRLVKSLFLHLVPFPRFPVLFLSGCSLYPHVDGRRTSIDAAIGTALDAGLAGQCLWQDEDGKGSLQQLRSSTQLQERCLL